MIYRELKINDFLSLFLDSNIVFTFYFNPMEKGIFVNINNSFSPKFHQHLGELLRQLLLILGQKYLIFLVEHKLVNS